MGHGHFDVSSGRIGEQIRVGVLLRVERRSHDEDETSLNTLGFTIV
jgi:hypothetical protein